MPELLARLQQALADRYRIERELGRGGMATVYLAHDLKHDRSVALKVLRPELAAALGPERFEREIKLAARLRHSHILTVYDSGNAAGQLWFTMPFIQGESLRDRLTREQQLPVDDALQITREVADALAYAHSHDVVHRDIKPENILLGAGHAMVADFGIARAIGAAGDQRLTETGLSIGTPAYMSPEQATGSKQLDGRTDIYSLGCVLYEMLAGDPPFTGATAQAIIARQLVDPPPRLRTVRPTVTAQLEQTLDKALAKVAADRFATAAEFAEALKVVSVSVAPQRTHVGALMAMRGRLGTRATVIVTVVVALLGAAWGVHRWWLGRSQLAAASAALNLDPRHIAVLNFVDVGEHRNLQYLADGLTETLINDLRPIQPLHVMSQNAVWPYRDARIRPDSIARALRVGTLVQGTLAPAGQEVRVTVALLDGATGAEIERRSVEAKDVFGLRNDLGLQVALLLRQRVGVDLQPPVMRSETRSAQAWEFVQRAKAAARSVDSLLASADTATATAALARADSQLARASEMDRDWMVPIVQRGWVAYSQRKIVGWGKGPASNWTRHGLDFAAQALRVHPRDAEALRLRGTLRYIRYLVGLDPHPLSSDQLLDSAEADLRAAADPTNPNQALAWSLLSHLLMGKSDDAGANLAAQWAYEADPYLPEADRLIYRAFASSFDREEAAQATELCGEGRRRFPKDPYFTECQFELMELPGQPVDVPRAWSLLEQDVNLWPPNARDFRRRRDQMLVALALANAGLKESADHVALRSRADSSVDPGRELLWVEAALRNRLGDRDESLRLLKQYLARNPGDRTPLANDQSWWWHGVHDDPRFKQLVGSASRH